MATSNETREFITKAYNSDASILVFFKNIGKENLIIRKAAKTVYQKYIFEDKIELILNKYDGTTHKYSISFESLSESKTDVEIFDDSGSDILKIFDPIEYDLKNFYELLQKQDFVLQFNKNIYEGDNYSWLQKDFYGLVIEQKYFSSKQSDYGSENIQIYVYANSKYFGFRYNTVFSFNIRPRDLTINIFDKIKIFGESMYDYFFKSKQYILSNFDEHELSPYSKVFFENRGHLLTDKKYMLPSEFVADTYIISTQKNKY